MKGHEDKPKPWAGGQPLGVRSPPLQNFLWGGGAPKNATQQMSASLWKRHRSSPKDIRENLIKHDLYQVSGQKDSVLKRCQLPSILIYKFNFISNKNSGLFVAYETYSKDDSEEQAAKNSKTTPEMKK